MALDLSRRNFLKLASAGLASWTLAPATLSRALPAWMPRPHRAWENREAVLQRKLRLRPRLAFAAENVEPQGDLLVCVFQRGGMDGLNAVIPHSEAEYYRRRPTLAVAEPKSGDDATGIDLDGFFGLHPALRPLKDVWDDKALAIVHATGSPDPTHSHFDAMDYMERGTPGEKSIPTGWIGRHLQTAPQSGEREAPKLGEAQRRASPAQTSFAPAPWQNESPFRAVGMGGAAQSSLRGPIPVTVLKSIADFHLAGRTQDLAEIQQTLTALYTLNANLTGPAESTFDAIEILEKVDVTNYTPEHNVQYPEGDFGMALMQIAQLAKAEVGLEVACVDIGGWDTHAAQGGLEGELPGLLTQLASGLAALYHDLGDRAKRVTIVTMSEFGRRVAENGSAGTDHGHGNAMFVLGGSVNGGKVYGDWPTLAPEKLADPGDLAITTDFRDVLGEIVQKRLANPKLAEVFPGYTEWKMRGVVRENAA